MRDAPLRPSLQSVVDESWGPTLDSLARALVPRGLGQRQRKRTRAAVQLALNLHTWESLNESGLGNRQAADLMADLIITSAAERD
ncbi:MAG: hypothetical protein HUJ31_05110 [Pseudomonadales bacterium]|nr:hypothetical protein [Pseudomonadales bacterium]